MSGSLPSALAGLGTGFGLIVAIGAQNAFLLRQALHREHHLAAAMLCSVVDLVVVFAAVAGIGGIVTHHPGLLEGLRVVGVLYLASYGVAALRRALKPVALVPAGRGGSLRAVAAACTAVSLLNPHLYLDAMMLGSIANAHGSQRWTFAAGIVVASVTWFFVLVTTASRLARVFSRPAAWRVVDVIVATVMAGMAVALALG